MNQSDTHLDRRLEYLGAWSGIAWLVLAASAFGGSGLTPVLSPSIDAEVLAAFVLEHRYQILVGMTVLLFGGFTFLVTWSLTFAYQIRKYANRSGMAFYLLMVVGLLGA